MKTFRAKEWKVVCLRETLLAESFAICDEPAGAAHYWNLAIARAPDFSPERESLYVIHLNTRRRITGHHLVSHGLVDTCLSHPREVFRAAIIANAKSIILAHNHPSGCVIPSEDDVKITMAMRRAGRIIGIEVVDHLIMSLRHRSHSADWCSLRALGCFSRRRRRVKRRR